MLTQFQINNIEIPIPSYQEQKDIILRIKTDTKQIDAAIILKEQEIEKLKEYKGSLINGVVTGKVKII